MLRGSKHFITIVVAILAVAGFLIFVYPFGFRPAVDPEFSRVLEQVFGDSFSDLKLTSRGRQVYAPVDAVALENEIRRIINSNPGNYSIYFRDMPTDLEIKINADRLMPPGSVSKLPYAVLVLKDIQEGKYSLDTTYPVQSGLKISSADSLYYTPSGTYLTLRQYIESLIRYSDNTAMMHLETFLGGNSVYNQRIQNELGVQHFFRSPHEATATDVGRILHGIYFGLYLNSDYNTYLIHLLSTTTHLFDDRIVAGLVDFPEARVAHKIGNIGTEAGLSYNDVGIVYGSERDFILVVLDTGLPSNWAGANTIAQLSHSVYQVLNR